VFLVQQPTIADQAHQAPDGVGTPAEPKKKDLVVLFMVFDQIPVSVQDVLIQASPGGPTQDSLQSIAVGAHSPVIESRLGNAINALFQSQIMQSNHIRGVGLLWCVPSAVGKNSDPLYHDSIPHRQMMQSGWPFVPKYDWNLEIIESLRAHVNQFLRPTVRKGTVHPQTANYSVVGDRIDLARVRAAEP